MITHMSICQQKMKNTLLFTLTCVCASPLSAADQESWQFEHKKIPGVYGIYGGGLGDPVAPTQNDSKISFSIRGTAAKEMFAAMGPDIKDVCTEGSGDRVREKDDGKLSCVRTKKGEFFCNVGFDLRNGKSIGGSTC
jgi:hypothetical protein